MFPLFFLVTKGLTLTSKFIDRKAGLCGLYASQILPSDDAKSVELTHIFERAIYKEYEVFKSHA